MSLIWYLYSVQTGFFRWYFDYTIKSQKKHVKTLVYKNFTAQNAKESLHYNAHKEKISSEKKLKKNEKTA